MDVACLEQIALDCDAKRVHHAFMTLIVTYDIAALMLQHCHRKAAAEGAWTSPGVR